MDTDIAHNVKPDQKQPDPQDLSFDPAVCAFEILKRSYEERRKHTRRSRDAPGGQNADER
ncbi:hypothetical protein [Burkholderia pseudomallei]|uniref:hypothetical protein n=1 Tax=Burkholderia pseudomallei TaxID=28450 RepID=UPI0034DE80ED